MLSAIVKGRGVSPGKAAFRFASSQDSSPSWEPRADRPALSRRCEAPHPRRTPRCPVGAGRVRAVAPRAFRPP